MAANLREEDDKKRRLVASAMLRLQAMKRHQCIDPNDLESRPTPAQEKILADFGKIKHQYIRGGNQSSKTSLFARTISWVLDGTHPHWVRPGDWGTEPLLILIAGRTGKQIEDSILPRIINFLDPSTYKIVRIGNIIQRLEMTSGDRVIFQSLENPSIARERLQSYTAHIAWCDELPPTLEILSELHRRVQAKNGLFLASFTPITPNYEIQQYIDSVEHILPGYARVYRLNMLDNPIYAVGERRAEILRSIESLPEKMKNAVLYGDWVSGEENVYEIDEARVFRDLPSYYSPATWRHVESVDPAMESATGVSVWGEDPKTGEWYCVLAEYVVGLKDPVSWVHAVRKLTSKYNIIRRVSDVAPWFTSTAYSELKLTYTPVHNKSGRKKELIGNFQNKLGTRLFVVPRYCSSLLKEIQDCRWSERTEGKIVNSQSFHLLDSAQYFSDNIPGIATKSGGLMGDGIQAETWSEWLYKANAKRQLNESGRRDQNNIKLTSKSRIWR